MEANCQTGRDVICQLCDPCKQGHEGLIASHLASC
jgi:hypothetical protein